MDEWTIKTPNPICRLFFKNWPVNRLCGIMFNRFYRLGMHSLMVGILDPACELLPQWTKELYLCTVAPLLYLWPPPPLPLPKQIVQWGVLNCAVDHILQEFNTLFLARFRTYKIASPPQTKWPVKTKLRKLRDWCLYSSFVHGIQYTVYSHKKSGLQRTDVILP